MLLDIVRSTHQRKLFCASDVSCILFISKTQAKQFLGNIY